MELPKHSINEAYPFVKPVSVEAYPASERIGEIMHIENGVINMDRAAMEKKLGLEPNGGHGAFDQAFVVGMVDRLLKAEHGLKETEAQVEDMMRDLPFVPEAMGFDKIKGPEGIEDDPILIYKSRLTSGILLTREVGKSNNWILMRDGVKTRLLIPCERVAYHIFYALGVPMRDPEGSGGE